MKKFAIAVSTACCLLLPAAAIADECFRNRRVVQVNTGYVDLSYGADSGDAIYFTLDNGQRFPLNRSFNLDWPRGQALHRTLLLAMAGRFSVDGHDHYGTRCDDIDEIIIKN